MASRRSRCQVERMTDCGASRIDRHILLGWAHKAQTRLAYHGRVARALSASRSHSRIHSGRIVQRSALVDRLTTVGARRVRSTWPMVAEMYSGEVRRISSTVRPTSRSPRERNKSTLLEGSRRGGVRSGLGASRRRDLCPEGVCNAGSQSAAAPGARLRRARARSTTPAFRIRSGSPSLETHYQGRGTNLTTD